MAVDGKVTIAGGGPCGALLAMVLKARGFDVTVFELRQEKDFQIQPAVRDGGVDKLRNATSRSINLALSHRGIESLKEVGVADPVMEMAIPMPSRFLHLEGDSSAVQPYGKEDQAIYSVSRPEISSELVRQAQARGVHFRFGYKFAKMDADGTCHFVSTRGGPTPETVSVSEGVVFGCDGAYSAVRNAMNRHGRLDHHTFYIKEGYKELSMPPVLGPDSKPTYAMPPNHLHIWPRNSFMLIALPNRDYSFTCTLFAPMSDLEDMQQNWTEQQVQDFFKTTFPDAFPLMPTVARDMLDGSPSPLMMVKVSPWQFKNVVVLGDASHAVVPFYGQGMNAVFEDCLVVAELLDSALSDADPGQSKIDVLLRVATQVTAARKPAADALSTLAMMNYRDMAHNTASVLYLIRKRIEAILHSCLPRTWLPLYTMVTFTRIPYNKVLERHERQERILQRLGIGAVASAVASIGWLAHRTGFAGVVGGLFFRHRQHR
eukprot:CAMPEP_0118962780 /NCGR_PEP_ID=MMETSP1173-20130426/988_1 /TAXON_ID=1034831 /ORGANISM="Rhizochromulina marina cf, Strain CCMP1243" /LENGTH=487 /DNA_ID=CAMNT_0006911079 /DNA_START=1 /DNA_END=1464 /DNA_ORIENTATION=+